MRYCIGGYTNGVIRHIMILISVTPRVSTQEMASQNANVGDALELVCFFQSVPLPDGVFLRDGVMLDESDPRITVITTNTSSTLTLTDIRGDEGGVYSCRLNNSIGAIEIGITTLTVPGKSVYSRLLKSYGHLLYSHNSELVKSKAVVK